MVGASYGENLCPIVLGGRAYRVFLPDKHCSNGVVQMAEPSPGDSQAPKPWSGSS